MLDHSRLESGSQQVGEAARRCPGNWEAGGWRLSSPRSTMPSRSMAAPRPCGCQKCMTAKSLRTCCRSLAIGNPSVPRGPWLASSPPSLRIRKASEEIGVGAAQSGLLSSRRSANLALYPFLVISPMDHAGVGLDPWGILPSVKAPQGSWQGAVETIQRSPRVHDP